MDRCDFSLDEHASNNELQWMTSDHVTVDPFAPHSTYNLFLQTISPFRGTSSAVLRDRTWGITKCQKDKMPLSMRNFSLVICSPGLFGNRIQC